MRVIYVACNVLRNKVMSIKIDNNTSRITYYALRITHHASGITHHISLIIMTDLIVIAVIVFITVFIIAKILKKDDTGKSICPACGKVYGGNPGKCPHCGEQLRWKNR